MTPLTRDQADIGNNRKNDPFQETRRNEILDFWNSGEQYARLKTSGEKSLCVEKTRYVLAIRELFHQGVKIRYPGDIEIHNSKGRIIAERMDMR